MELKLINLELINLMWNWNWPNEIDPMSSQGRLIFTLKRLLIPLNGDHGEKTFTSWLCLIQLSN